MPCRRRLNRLRTPRTLALLMVALLFVGIFLTYSTLSGHDDAGTSTGSSSLPSMEKRKSHYKAAHPNAYPVDLDRSQLRTLLDRQFQSGLRLPEVREVISLLYPLTWKLARDPDEVAIILKDYMLSLNLPSNMSCRDINEHQILGTLVQSNRKFVERLEEPEEIADSNNGQRWRQHRRLMAVKSQASDVQTKIACMKQVYNADFCGPMGNYLLMREIFLLRFLQHPNLIPVLGYCLRGDQVSMELRKKGLVMVMEAGTPLVSSLLTSLSWAHRVQLALDAASLLEYLQSSPLGSVGLPQVQMKDFVIVDHRSLKLTDMDEAILGDRQCTQTSDCSLQGSDVGVQCDAGLCMGLNHRMNLRVVGSYILEPLLQQMPLEERPDVEKILSQIRTLELPSSDLVNFLEAMARKYPVAEEDDLRRGYHKQTDREAVHTQDRQRWQAADNDDAARANRPGEQKGPVPWKDKHMKENPLPEQYIRLDSSNFPGQYDYPCPDSRVLWGCVMTFDRLSDAMERCNSDEACKSFVVFSPQPEVEIKMTVMFKSNGTGSPRVNMVTTLFIKRAGISSAGANDTGTDNNDHWDRGQPIVKNGMRNNQPPVPAEEEGEEEEDDEAEEEEEVWGGKEKERQECVSRMQAHQADALHSRQKRLMAHMGLKGKLENEWKKAVKSQSVTSFTHLRPLSGSGSRGGSMLVLFNTSMAGHNIPRAKFIAEDSSSQSHVAFAMIYEMDRLLGLYHTPPVVGGFIPTPVVDKFSANASWHSAFGSLKYPDGTLRGLFVAPTPKVMKRAELELRPLIEMVPEVVTFDRTQKMQLEYILLWWLGHIAKSSDLHRGFKGHLIHVDGDHGFQNPRVNQEGYFNHCQFPNVVYKMLACFRCQLSAPNPAGAAASASGKICSLGQEVVRRLEGAGFTVSNLHIPGVAKEDFPTLINSAASRSIEIVDKCIKEFGRESVLY